MDSDKKNGSTEGCEICHQPKGLTEDIVISAPRYVRVNQNFELNCSSFVVPGKKTAEFLLK
jgi:hypothetical protein